MSISSEVTYGAGRPELYRELSAAEDRAMTDTGSGLMPETLPSLEASRAQVAPGDWASTILAFDKDMFGFDEALRQNTPSSRYLLEQEGLPWPPPWTPANYTDPTVELLKNSIYKGWNAASQPGASPGMLEGFGRCGPVPMYQAGIVYPGAGMNGLGQCAGCGCQARGPCRCSMPGLGSDDDLDFDLHTTASFSSSGKRLSGLAGLAGFDAMDTPVSKARRVEGMRTVLTAAAKPTTASNREVTRKLLDQSEKLADQMEKYAGVAERAASFANVSLKRAGVADERTRELALRIFDPETGEVRSNAHPSDVERLRRLRREAFEAAREAVRSEKVKLVAKGQAENTFAQAAILQKLAAATVGGQPDAAAVYAKMFDKLGQEGVVLRGVREKQKANWLSKEVQELNGLEALDAIDNRVVTADYWEAELDGFEIAEDAYLGEIEGWLRRKIKKAAKKAARRVKKAARKVKGAARVVGAGVKSAAQAGAAAAKAAAQRAAKAAKSAATAAARRAAAAAAVAARKIKNSTVAKNFMKVATPVAKSIRSVAKVAIEPVRMSVQAGKRVIQGDFKGALSSVKDSAKRTIKGVTNAVRQGVFGVACSLENTRLGRAAGQAVGQAVGTIYGGGTAGGAVGREAGRKANDINRGMCKGMKQLGLTGDQKLNFTAKNLKKSLKTTAQDLKRTTFSKKAMLQSALRIAGGMAGGVGSNLPGAQDLAKFGTKQFTELGVKAVRDQSTKFLKNKGAQIIGSAAQKAGIPGAQRLVGVAASVAQGGGVPAILRQATPQQALTLLKQSAPQLLKQVTPQQAMAFAQKQAQARAVAFAKQQAQARVASLGQQRARQAAMQRVAPRVSEAERLLMDALG